MERCLLSLVLCLIVGIDYSLACTCRQYHPLELFCKADYVMRIRLMSPGGNNDKKSEDWKVDTGTNNKKSFIQPLNKKYNVEVKKIFKISENIFGFTKNATTAQLHTAADDSTCGVQLEQKKDYLVSGFYNGDKLNIDICGLVKHWFKISNQQRTDLESVYTVNCICKIFYPYWPKDVRVKDHECPWEVNQETNR